MSFNAYSKRTRDKLEIILASHIKDMRRSLPWTGENTHIVKKIMKLFRETTWLVLQLCCIFIYDKRRNNEEVKKY